MNLATGDTNPIMSVHAFAKLFKDALFPLFREDELKKFLTCDEGSSNDHKDSEKPTAVEAFYIKFSNDHQAVQALEIGDRMEKFKFNNEKVSVQNELFIRYIDRPEYMTKGQTDIR